MYLPKTYELCKKRACLLRIDGVIRVFTFFCPKFHGCFPLAAVGVKNVYWLNGWRPIVHVQFYWPRPGLCKHVCMDGLYKHSKFLFNQIKNRRVIRGENFRHSLQTLDCLFEPNLTFTDRDETGARRTVWTNDSLGPSARKFLSPLFRVMAPENWYLLMFDP